jgi:hypothetical protein
MTESEFEAKFDNGELDAEFAMFISERYDAWTKGAMMSYWEDPEAYTEFKDYMVDTIPAQSLLGSNPLDLFPTIWGSK